MVARLGELAAAVAEHRSKFDSDGRLPDDLFQELATLGLFRLLLPSSLGGRGLSALEFMDVVEAAAALDGTIGWLASNGGGMARVGAYLPAESAREIFDDPLAFVVSSTAALGRAVRVRGGYSVTGRWPFGSGSPHGTWFSPICAVEGDEQPTGEMIFVLAPRNDVLLHDNWQVSGLCATGSVDFELADVFVPDRLAHAFQPEPTQPGTLYRLPTRSIYSWTVATVPLGISAGAINDFAVIASSGRGASVPLGERELIQSQLGQIQARTAASRAYLRHTMRTLLEEVEAGNGLDASRVDFRLACTFASQSALWAIDLVTEMVGTVAIQRSSPLERRERDARAAAKHIAMSPAAYITGGKLRLGHDLSKVNF
ncbi:MAG TPA: acyl-CoA dehydrogenase family protein [Candidatus Limnocylindrales bacterium]|nr:acyl-CoA dehydrogenase family protein [Candidatus Limnocylindrales bacterium]